MNIVFECMKKKAYNKELTIPIVRARGRNNAATGVLNVW